MAMNAPENNMPLPRSLEYGRYCTSSHMPRTKSIPMPINGGMEYDRKSSRTTRETGVTGGANKPVIDSDHTKQVQNQVNSTP